MSLRGAGEPADEPARTRPVRATYRIQLTPEAGFAAAAERVEHLAELGVSHIYLSPLLTARPGSTHGYDVADPATVSAELGGEDGLRALAERAHAAGLGLVGDIVPNHVGTGPDNPLWMQLLAEGRAGGASAFFDVDWEPLLPGAAGKVILPVLGASYGTALACGELRLEETDEGTRLRYHDHVFPLTEASLEAVERSGGPEALNGEPGDTKSWQRLHTLLERQHYRLVHWKVGDALVNYRRFFAINDLAAVRVEDPDVFERTHATIVRLVRDGVLDGLRIDHVDGLSDPAGYLERLRAAVGDAWIVAEKILAPGERLPAWPIAGATGYDFLGDVLRLSVDPVSEQVLTEVAEAMDAWPADLHEAIYRAKEEILERDLLTDTDRLAHRLWALCGEHPDLRDIDWHTCRTAIIAITAALPVYRTYAPPGGGGSEADVARIGAAVDAALRRQSGRFPSELGDLLIAAVSGALEPTPLRDEVVRRFQQLTSAAMAKGVEDTFLYRQHRLVALNEVGVEPEPFGADADAFHRANLVRAAAAPGGMLTTATHDTKRGEDTRLRTAALTEDAEAWREGVARWVRANRHLVADVPSGTAPDAATEYLCYQALVGVWPLEQVEPALDELADRVAAYLVKAAREAKLRTSWIDPDEDFEAGIDSFVRALLDPTRSAAFLDDFGAVARRAGRIAAVTGLAQVLLRSTSPGVPDTYQGGESWRDDLVDPDNRRTVDATALVETGLQLAGTVDPGALLASWQDGCVKQWVLRQSLRAGRDHPGCVGLHGAYLPLEVVGEHAERVVAYARVAPDGDALVAVAPRLPGPLMPGPDDWPLGAAWGDTAVRLGDLHPTRDVLNLTERDRGAEPALKDLFTALPVALLTT